MQDADEMNNDERMAQPSVIEAQSHIEWPSWGVPCGTPDVGKLACPGEWKGGAQPAIQHAKPSLGGAGCKADLKTS